MTIYDKVNVKKSSNKKKLADSEKQNKTKKTTTAPGVGLS